LNRFYNRKKMKKTLLVFILLAFLTNAYAQLTPPSNLQSYYTDVDFSLSGTDLFNDLATETIAKHTNILEYGERHNYLYNVDEDITNNANVVLMYTGESRDKREYLSGNNSYNPQTFNTEHVYPQSLIVNNAKGDLHHLRTCDISVNSNRGNNPFAEGSGSYSNLGNSWYPGDEWKGDTARMVMYLNLRYDESFTDVGTLNLFLKWNAEDPVSDFEKQRNEIIFSAQGNRNPFIDNPFIATIIWGDTAAENTWGAADNEAPTVPTNVTLMGITTSSINISWTTSQDNEAVSKYEIYANGELNGETANITYTASGLSSNTTYAITVLAKDIANNKSAQSTAVNGTTLADNTAPTVPTNVTISNQAGTSFKVNWTASTDNSTTIEYDVFVDGNLNGTTTNINYDVTDLTTSATYSVSVLAKDATNNMSAQSAPVNATTTDGSSDVSELFFSEYVEGSGLNKALEIINLTGNTIGLSAYTIKRQSNGDWETPLQLVGSINVNNVYVIINGSTTLTKLQQEKDLEVANVTPMTFNGDDRVGLFKNDVLIDIIGDLNGTNTFAENITLRRSIDVKGPSTDYSEQREWFSFDTNDVSDIGNFNGTLSTNNNTILETYKIYPNPTNGNTLYFNITKDSTVKLYNVLGKLIKIAKVNTQNKSLDISTLSKGIYILKIKSGNQFSTKKIIKN
jgi:endonuclease I/chitodextrinase